MFAEQCDKHPSARAQVRVDLDAGGSLFFCNHCAHTYFPHGEHDGVTFTYATVKVA